MRKMWSFALLVLSISVGAQAGTVNVTTLDGSQGVAFDPDSPAPTITADGFHATGTTGEYNSVRFTADALGLTGLTLGDILSIAYDHQQAGGGLDWQLKVYTESTAATGSGWYGYRLNYDLSTGNADGSWATFTDTNAGAERIKAFNAPDAYNYPSNHTAFDAGLLAANSLKVQFFDISAGAKTGGYPYDTYLQDITINTTLGSGTVHATAVPLPAAAWGGMGLMGLLAGKRFWKKRAA